MDVFYVTLLFFLHHRSAWHLIQPKEYQHTVPCLTPTSTIWRGARKSWIPTCRPARTARKWIPPNLPWADRPEDLLGGWGVPRGSLAELWSIAGWRPPSCCLPDGLCFSEGTTSFTVLKSMQEWLQLYVHSFVCVSVCFKNLEEFQKRSCWSIVLPFHFFWSWMLPAWREQPGHSWVRSHVSSLCSCWGLLWYFWVSVCACVCVCVILDLLKSVTFYKQEGELNLKVSKWPLNNRCLLTIADPLKWASQIRKLSLCP